MTRMASFLRSTLIMLGLGILILLGMVTSSLWLVQVNSRYSEETAELRRIRAAIVDLVTTIQDAETGQRGYLLTTEAAYLDPYEKAVSEIPARQKRLNDTVASRPDYAEGLSELQQAIDRKMVEVTGTVDLARAGKIAEAYDLVRSDSGLVYMNQIRTTLNGYLGKTDDRLRIIVAEQLSAANNLRWVTIAGAISIFVVIGGALAIIIQFVRDLIKSREEIDEMNKSLEARVDERTQDLMRANQEIQKFAYIVTHDLRAPLVNIMGFLSELDTSVVAIKKYVLADGVELDRQDIQDARLAVEEDLPEAMGFIRSSTRKMDQLINAILKISRDGRRKLQPEVINLRDLLEATIASVQHQIAESEGSAEIDVRVSSVVSDRISLDQIFGNLLDNAVKYQMPGRPLRLSVKAYPEAKGTIGIDVADNGRGIDTGDMERVFELFRRAGEQDKPGEGIGLAHVRSLIRNLGGDITVASELGKGSTFKLTLPYDLRKITRSSEI